MTPSGRRNVKNVTLIGRILGARNLKNSDPPGIGRGR
jgi:hypothetical protein